MSEDADTEPVAVAAQRPLSSFPDRYAPGAELGRGGMGRVVEAHDRLLGRAVALKEALDTGEDALRRFSRETLITARLEHPSIVPVYDAGVSPDGSPFYVMRKVTGQPLDKLVGATQRLDDRLALLPHVLAACQAVAHAHERGVIHRDLKPSNILVGALGETVVIDWGLAKATGVSDPPREAVEPTAGESLRTQAGTVFGTPGYMPPEQHASADVDERADVYALGATLYYTLSTKSPPANGPAPPLAHVVSGVPRELSAIIDKALADDLALRYRNAGALAADLARFTTGQLVAAHDYSTRERIARFVRRHRALVITVAAASVILAVGAWIAVGRVLSARDEAISQARAAETARAREAERSSDLVISQARLLLDSNPTGAVAMVRPLAGTARWREARAVAAGARAAGVARRFPGPSKVAYLEISFDGTHALVCGADGSIHLYDLRARTHTVVATLPGRVRAVFSDETHVLAWTDATFTVIDLATNATKVYERPAKILRVDAHHGIAYFVDETRHAWRLDVATGDVIGIPVPGQVTHVALSPDGKRVALAGEQLWLIETKHPELVEQIHAGKKFDLAWAPNSEHLATIGEHATYDITIHPEIEVEEYGITNQSITLARGSLYTIGLNGLTVDERKLGAADLGSAIVGLFPTRGEFVVGVAREALLVFDGMHVYRMPVPIAPINALRASPRSPYIVAACADAILVWSVDDVMPRRVEVPSYSQLATIGRDRAWSITTGAPARSIDVHTGEQREIGKLPPLRYATPSSGDFVVARPLSSKETWIVRADGTTETIDTDGTFAAVLDDRRVAYATKQHQVVLYDVTARTRTTIATYSTTAETTIERLLARESSPRWLVAVLSDGTLARHDLTAGTATQTRIAPHSDGFAPGGAVTAAMLNGDVFFASGARLVRWRADGTTADHVTLPRSIKELHLLDDGHVLVIADDGTGYSVPTGRGEFVRLPTSSQSYAWGVLDPSLIVTDDRTGGVTVLDVVANASWKIARATPAGMTPDVSGDGTVVVLRDATLESLAIALWPLDLPTTPEATARWVDDLTNATFDPRTGMLGWGP